MNSVKDNMKIICTFLTVCGLAAAQAPQAPNPVRQSTDNTVRMAAGTMPIYRITVVARTTKAINYNHRSGSTKIGFRGTALMPAARGEANVESKQGVIKIDARMEKLQPAGNFGPEYLTYVMWAITPEGRATNIGEVLLDGDKTRLDATTELQSFGLIVTAEPYFAVTQPSDAVVMENFVRPDTTGTIEQVDAKFELLQRGQYTLNVNPADIRPLRMNSKVPLELYEARNAVQIARWTGAERYAPETFQKAVQGLENAEGYLKGKAGKKPIGTVAREAVQMAEDARIITVKKIDEERLASERQAAADREARSESGRVAAQADAARVTRDAETAQAASKSEADRVKHENAANMEAVQNEADRAQRANAAQLTAAQSEAGRLRHENDAKMVAAQTAADKLKSDNATQLAAAATEADRLKRENDAKTVAAQAAADKLKSDNATQLAAAQTEADRLKHENDAKTVAAQTAADKLKSDNATQLAAAQTEADRLKHENDAKMAAAQTAADKLKSDNDAQFTAAHNEADRLKRENDAKTVAAQAAADKLKSDNDAQFTAAHNEADRLKRENDAQRVSTQAELDRASQANTLAQTEKAELRTQLLNQFNAILQTQDTARGLIVNMSDVLFDTGKYSLRPLAREKLAKVAGIVSGYPGLKLDVEGHTDSVGGDEYNQRLSEQRGAAVRDFLIQQGMVVTSVTTQGFGKTQPVASNDTAEGRQQNRRVEIVISGDAIGTVIGLPPAAK
jgi:outer membrane protein OmpA-like peptidoglycan-associated protein